jgi:hypothetical protein
MQNWCRIPVPGWIALPWEINVGFWGHVEGLPVALSANVEEHRRFTQVKSSVPDFPQGNLCIRDAGSIMSHLG